MPTPLVKPAILTGQVESHLCTDADAVALGARIHLDALEPFRSLQAEARTAGFDLRILSGFRSFEQQLLIWNRKAAGKRPVLDSAARPLDITTMSERELALAILQWSALPGASRHHWGTDLNVFDEVARPDGYEVDLIPAEVDPGGMFGPLHEWLDSRIATGTAFGFFRPYDRDRGGVAPERWHLSHGPTARPYLAALTVELLRKTLRRADMALKTAVLDELDAIHQRFVTNINTDPA